MFTMFARDQANGDGDMLMEMAIQLIVLFVDLAYEIFRCVSILKFRCQMERIQKK